MSGEQPGPVFTGIVVPLPDLQPLVGPIRARFDAAYPAVPAHVSALVPWIPPDELTEADLDGLAQLAKEWQPFDVSFGAFGRFEIGDAEFDVHYLAPEPAEDFLTLTEDICSVWPEYQPYEGVHDEVVPHLTLASTATDAEAAEFRRQLSAELPIRTRATELVVFEIRDGVARIRRTLALGGKKRR